MACNGGAAKGMVLACKSIGFAGRKVTFRKPKGMVCKSGGKALAGGGGHAGVRKQMGRRGFACGRGKKSPQKFGSLS